MMKRTENNERQRGFTLLEMLIAVSLLAIGLVATASMQVTAINSNGIANRISVTSSLAQEVMEDIMGWNTSDARFIASSVNTVYDLDPAGPGTSIVITAAGTFNATYSITVNTPGSKAVRIDVTVTNATTNRQVTLTSLKRVL